MDDQLKKEIYHQIQYLLEQNHTIKEKQQVKDANDRLNFSCPYCGDSTVNYSKKRGNLYWDTLQYHCYNCGYHTNLYKFLKDYNIKIRDRNVSHQILDYIDKNKVQSNTGVNILKHSGLKQASELAISYHDFKKTFGAHEIKPGHWIWNYLKSRLLHKKIENFMFSPKDKRLWILNFDHHGYIVGAQSRKMYSYGSKYYTYDLIKLRKECGFKTQNYDESTIQSITKLSTMFGIYQINFQKPLTLFEGPIDSMFMLNSLGLASANRSTEEFDQIPTVQYLYDNDETGRKKMVAKLKKGCYVFLWNSFINNFGLGAYNIKDFNDLIVSIYHNNPEAIKHLRDYFSNHKLNLWYL